MATALVTGGSGFMGSALIRRLDAAGCRVVTLGRRPPRGFRGTHLDWTGARQQGLSHVLSELRPQRIFHLAGAAVGSEAELQQANVEVATHLLEAAAALDEPPVVMLTGSAAEYGAVAEHDLPAREELPCRPQNTYGLTKLRQTELGLAYAERGLPVVIARCFNAIGPGMPDYLAVGRFVRAVAALGPEGGVLRTGPLTAVRDFVAIDDMVAALEALSTNPAARGAVVNIASGHGITMQDLVDLLIEIADSDISVAVDDDRGGVNSVSRMVGSTDRLRSLSVEVPRPEFRRVLREALDAARDSAGGHSAA